MRRKFTKIQKVARFLLYSVVLSTVPFLMSAIHTWWIGYDFNLSEYTPDFILITFAVAVNIYGYATDMERNFSVTWKRVFACLAFLSVVTCVFFYSLFLRAGETGLTLEGSLESKANLLAMVSAGILLENVLAGVIMEGWSS